VCFFRGRGARGKEGIYPKGMSLDAYLWFYKTNSVTITRIQTQNIKYIVQTLASIVCLFLCV